jgi:hypothetical protein
METLREEFSSSSSSIVFAIVPYNDVCIFFLFPLSFPAFSGLRMTFNGALGACSDHFLPLI